MLFNRHKGILSRINKLKVQVKNSQSYHYKYIQTRLGDSLLACRLHFLLFISILLKPQLSEHIYPLFFLYCQIVRHYHASAFFVVCINSNSSSVNKLTALLIPLALGLGKTAEEFWHRSHPFDMELNFSGFIPLTVKMGGWSFTLQSALYAHENHR